MPGLESAGRAGDPPAGAVGVASLLPGDGQGEVPCPSARCHTPLTSCVHNAPVTWAIAAAGCRQQVLDGTCLPQRRRGRREILSVLWSLRVLCASAAYLKCGKQICNARTHCHPASQPAPATHRHRHTDPRPHRHAASHCNPDSHPTPTPTLIPTLPPQQAGGPSGIPDPRATAPELFDLRNPAAPIPQFVHAMKMGGIEVNPQTVVDNGLAQGISPAIAEDLSPTSAS